MRALTAVLFGMAITACDDPAYVVEMNVSYDPAAGIYGTFDFYEPRPDRVQPDPVRPDAARPDAVRDGSPDGAAGRRPALMAIHGGAWRGGDKAWGQQIAEEFCASGFVVFAVNYRLAGRPGGTWPAQIQDVQNALKYIRMNADRFGIDPDRIAAIGMSAGGHLATMLALRDDPAGPDGRVHVAVNLDGEHDMTMPPDSVMADFDDIMTDVLGHPAPWSDAELRDISTVTFARPDVALLTVHGAGDDNVYVAQADRVTAALAARGARVELVRIEGGDGRCHEDCWRVPVARHAIDRFLARELSTTTEGR